MDFERFRIESYRRVLVAAPHPDDETLGNGGLVQRAQAAEAQVKVMIASNAEQSAHQPSCR